MQSIMTGISEAGDAIDSKFLRLVLEVMLIRKREVDHSECGEPISLNRRFGGLI